MTHKPNSIRRLLLGAGAMLAAAGLGVNLKVGFSATKAVQVDKL